MKIAAFVALLLVWPFSTGASQAQATPSRLDANSELLAGQLEEIAMCHHAIKAAHHDGLALNQNPYYRYILNSPHKGHGQNVYPIPERCKNLATDWILNYTNMSATLRGMQDKVMQDAVAMTISDMATDAQFLSVVINKMALEGEQAILWENRDKDIP